MSTPHSSPQRERLEMIERERDALQRLVSKVDALLRSLDGERDRLLAVLAQPAVPRALEAASAEPASQSSAMLSRTAPPFRPREFFRRPVPTLEQTPGAIAFLEPIARPLVHRSAHTQRVVATTGHTQPMPVVPLHECLAPDADPPRPGRGPKPAPKRVGRVPALKTRANPLTAVPPPPRYGSQSVALPGAAVVPTTETLPLP